MKHEHYLVTNPEKGKLIEGYKPGTYKITGTEKNENPDLNNLSNHSIVYDRFSTNMILIDVYDRQDERFMDYERAKDF